MNNPYYFNLDKAIASWRRTMVYNRAFTDDDLDELEQHVRDQVDGLRAQGLPEQEAFRRTMHEMGDYSTAEAEYRKVYWGKRRRHRELLSELTWRFSMLTNYLKVALRTLLRQKGYAFINISGLAIGMACCLFIALYIAHELSYDRHYDKADRIYRVVVEYHRQGEGGLGAFSTTPLAEALVQEYPDVEQAARMAPDLFEAGSNLVRTERDDQNRYEEGFVYVDPSFLDLFQFPMVAGERSTALTEPFTMVLTEQKAMQLFPDGGAVGNTIILNNNTDRPFIVTGILSDLPTNTHFQFDYLLSMEGVAVSKIPNWGFSNYVTYVQLAPETDPAVLEAKLPDFLMKYQRERYEARIRTGNSFRYILQPLTDIHLYSDDIQGYWVHGDIQYVSLFGAIALFILLLASINFMNLSTARSADRAREIGMRKVLGSHRRQLTTQFLTESVLVSLLAFGLGLLLVWLLLPVFNGLTGQAFSIPWDDVRFYPTLLAVAILLGLLAGTYPSVFLSSFKPIRVLQGKLSMGSKQGTLRSALVVLQFTTSIVLISSTMVVWQQMNFIQNKNLGYDKEQVLLIEDSNMLGEQLASFKEELRKMPAVQRVSVSSFLPVAGYVQNYTGAWLAKNPKETRVGLAKWFVDPDYVQTMGLNLVEGRDFSEELASDSAAIILNRKAVALLGLDDPIGQQVSSYTGLDQETGELFYDTYTVIGVVDDFHFKSLKNTVEGLSLVLGNFGTTTLVKTSTTNLAHTLNDVEKLWTAVAPNQSFRYNFLDERFEQMYVSEARAGTLFTIFAGLAILIACLGLFGLAAFTAQSRTKEIGVRKVLGASVPGLVALLSKDSLKLVGIAFVVAVPLAYVAMTRWLEDFAYRVAIEPGVFVLTGALVLLIALATVSYQSIKAALADPVKSLRYE